MDNTDSVNEAPIDFSYGDIAESLYENADPTSGDPVGADEGLDPYNPPADPVDPPAEDPQPDDPSVEDPKPVDPPADDSLKQSLSEIKYTAKGPDGREFVIRGDTVLTLKADKKEHQVPIAEALRFFAAGTTSKRIIEEADGKRVAAESLRAEAEAAKAQYQADRARLTEEIKPYAEAVKMLREAYRADDPLSLFKALAPVIGEDPYIAYSKHKAATVKQLKDYIDADEIERKRLDLDEKNRYVDDRAKDVETQQRIAARMQEGDAYIRTQLSTNGLSEKDWVEAVKVLHTNVPTLPAPADVVRMADSNQLKQYIDAALAQAKATKWNTGLTGLITQAVPDVSEKELEVVKEVIGTHYGSMPDSDLIDVVKQVIKRNEVTTQAAATPQKPAEVLTQNVDGDYDREAVIRASEELGLDIYS